MDTVMVGEPMAKHTESPKSPKRNDVPVKMDADAVRIAKIAASFKGISLAEYLSVTILPIAQRDIDAGHAQLRATETKRGREGK